MPLMLRAEVVDLGHLYKTDREKFEAAFHEYCSAIVDCFPYEFWAQESPEKRGQLTSEEREYAIDGAKEMGRIFRKCEFHYCVLET